MKLNVIGILGASLMFLSCSFEDPHTLNVLSREEARSLSETTGRLEDSRTNHNIYDFSLYDITAQPVSLREFHGKVLLLVNTASRCGYTAQLRELQRLYREYEGKGFEVLAFPSNDFGGQELETNEAIALFARTQFGVDFPLFAKTRVRGDDKHPLFPYLTTQYPPEWEVRYNFEKFLIDRSGRVIGRYSSDMVPFSPEIRADIERALSPTG